MKARKWYALVYFPELNNNHLNEFRKQYDPTYSWIREHVPVLFPVPPSTGQDNLKQHIQEILEEVKPFRIHIEGLFRSWDHWLLLSVKDGSEELMNQINNYTKKSEF